ncbi:MAG: sulfurtransferase TusA family protein [Clostridia bacterium]
MTELDCLGDVCPLPLMKLQREKERLERGERVRVITDHSCTCESLQNYCKRNGYRVEMEEPVSGVWEITISK